ncbi:type-F conjugative transfer system pilin acetylase TraX [Citrobacter freundii]|uniref:type-F conjugative transfer system pilin acetylase TraX n=1 Tax=Citrobacter freundii TaxID=546 RepID=UPI00383BBAEA
MIQSNTRKGIPFLCIALLQRDVIKIIAFLAMVADHVATATGVGSPWLNLVGRCAFPLFALVCGCNLMGKTPRQSTLNRLWLMALLAQPAFWLAFRGAGNQWWQLNILFCFALVLQLCQFLQNPSAVKGFLSGVCVVFYLPLSTASYGWAGLVMIAMAVMVWQVKTSYQGVTFIVWLITVAAVNGSSHGIAALSGVLLTLVVICGVHVIVPAAEQRLWVSRWFAEGYTIQLLLIALAVASLRT